MARSIASAVGSASTFRNAGRLGSLALKGFMPTLLKSGTAASHPAKHKRTNSMQNTESPEPKLIQAVRADDYRKAMGLLVAGARPDDKSRELLKTASNEMREVFRAHLICG